MIKPATSTFSAAPRIPEERLSRIVSAALEVFSESSFGEATTDKIAHRARVSKRDIYAAFPDKHAILVAVINMVLQNADESFTRVITDTQETATIEQRLEIIGMTLVGEILSPVTGFVSRLILSESARQPPVGVIFFENWYARRSQLIAQILAEHVANAKERTRHHYDTGQASKHYMALITYLPQLTAGVGMREIWNPKSIQAHVQSAVECFLKAHPIIA